jgi:hypothetical protein
MTPELSDECHGDSPPRWLARLDFHDRADHRRDGQSIQHHYRRFATVLGKAAASRLSRVSNFYCLHTAPMVVVRDTVLRRSAPYQGRVNQNLEMSADQWPDNVRWSDIEPRFVACVRAARCAVRPVFRRRNVAPRADQSRGAQ